MLAIAATSSFTPVTSSPSPVSGAKGTKIGGGPANLGGLKSKHASCGGLQVKANAQGSPKINGTTVVTSVESLKHEDDFPSPPLETFINQIPDWRMLIHPFGMGKFVQDGLAFRQNFSIGSYEVGADRTAFIETLMNYLQETALNHVKTAGLLGDGFGSTPEMCKKNLIWVATRMQVVVDRYPTWGDVVQVDNWVFASGKKSIRLNWLLSDCKTGEILTRASSVCVMMNKLTRRLSKIPLEVRGQMESYLLNSAPILEEDNRKLPKLDDTTADYIRTGLRPRWSDLDVNQHVNNVKYIGLILESVPQSIFESHELSAMTLDYRRECSWDSVLQSLTAVAGADVGNIARSGHVKCKHLLRLEHGAEVVRGTTEWKPKNVNNFGIVNQVPAEIA